MSAGSCSPQSCSSAVHAGRSGRPPVSALFCPPVPCRPSRRTPLPVRQTTKASVGPMGPQGAGRPTSARRGLRGPRRARKGRRVRRGPRPNRPAGRSRATRGPRNFGARGTGRQTGAPGPARRPASTETPPYARSAARRAHVEPAANTPIAFRRFVAQPAAATQNAGVHALVTPGTYLVTAVLNPPPSSALATDAVLRANGTPISSTPQTRIANGDNAAATRFKRWSHIDRRNDRQPDLFRRALALTGVRPPRSPPSHSENRINIKPARQKPSGRLLFT